MHLEQHEERGKAVILTASDLGLLYKSAKDTRQKIGFKLGGQCGLRSHEIIQVRPVDVIDGPAGPMVKVEHGKGDKYRETPLPNTLRETIEAYADVRPQPIDHPLLGIKTRQFRRWVSEAADRCRAETKDDRWRHLSTHDLRRSWGNLLIAANVEHGQIMEWGGWSDWETFRESYLARYTPERQRQEREKVEWL